MIFIKIGVLNLQRCNKYNFEQDIIYNITIIKYTIIDQNFANMVLISWFSNLNISNEIMHQPKCEFKTGGIIHKSIKERIESKNMRYGTKDFQKENQNFEK